MSNTVYDSSQFLEVLHLLQNQLYEKQDNSYGLLEIACLLVLKF